MRYIYMDNFRGFHHSLIPLSQITFLVGENSTGKSSFLKLIYFLFDPSFLILPGQTLSEDAEFGSFRDIVSAWATDKSYFQIGRLIMGPKKDEGLSFEFVVFTFTERGGAPSLSRYIHFDSGKVTKLRFTNKQTRYKVEETTKVFSTVDGILSFFRERLSSDSKDKTGFRRFPKEIPPRPPLLMAKAILQSLESSKPGAASVKILGAPFADEFMWIAPIRTKPRRFYHSLRSSFSPEGDHTPSILRRSLETRAKSFRFVEALKAFGKASGLFETIVAHSFARSPQAPFELLIRLSKVELNITNVGYGVSQVLPLVVEFLTQEKVTFAVQQPEIHLHPRAQAALGDLIYELAKERGHSFLLETHSDYLIDRARLAMHADEDTVAAQVLFFERADDGNHVNIIPISSEGRYPHDQPKAFREFFIKEEMSLLEI